jgi:hypothetical protein
MAWPKWPGGNNVYCMTILLFGVTWNQPINDIFVDWQNIQIYYLATVNKATV